VGSGVGPAEADVVEAAGVAQGDELPAPAPVPTGQGWPLYARESAPSRRSSPPTTRAPACSATPARSGSGATTT
jgi:hypothetical protein